MKKVRKLVSAMLALSLLAAGTFPFCAFADYGEPESEFFASEELPVPEDENEWLFDAGLLEEVVESGEEGAFDEEDACISVDDETGYISFEEEEDFFDIEPERPLLMTAEPKLLAAASADKYDGRSNFTAVKDQGVNNWCWAFSTAALAEASMVKQGKAQASGTDYSEAGLTYFMYHSPSDSDPLSLITGDKNEITASGKDYLSLGGNPVYAAMMLSGWEGMQDESEIPLSSASDSPEIPGSKAFRNKAVLTEASFLNIKNNASAVKSAIKTYGGVTAEIYAGSRADYKVDESGRYCYWNGTEGVKANHSVVIVGWDDAFPKESFGERMASPSDYKNTPEADGAWLVRNSWGTFGNSGYFWLSYEDKSLGASAAAMKFVPAATYDHNYHYDGTAGYSTNTYRNAGGETVGTLVSGGSIGNIFRVQSDFEEIRAVSMGVQSVGVKYSIQIYAKSSKMENPTDGEAMLSSPVTGTVTANGLQCITLPKPVYLVKGDYFSVVITFTAAGAAVQVYTDKSINYTQNGQNYITMTNATAAGQSFLKTKSESTWADLYKTDHSSWTFRIKAFTKEVAERKINPSGVKLQNMALEAGETGKIAYTLAPANASSQTGVNYTSGSPEVAAVDASGNVTALKAGTAEITCTVSYPGGSVSGKCTVTVAREYPADIYFKTDSIEMKKGAQRTLSFSFDPASASKSGLTFEWTSNDASVASVTKVSSGLSATVKVKSNAALGDECTVTVRCVERPGLFAECYITVSQAGGSSGGSSGGGVIIGGGIAAAKTGASQATFSKNWYESSEGVWKIRNKEGADVVSAWLCDDAVTANGQNVWYFMNTDGTMVSAGLVHDNTGNYYSLETEHNGYFGMLRYKNGYYKVNGADVYIEFEQAHNGSFGAILNQAAVDALKAAYGVTEYAVGNESCIYTSSF